MLWRPVTSVLMGRCTAQPLSSHHTSNRYTRERAQPLTNRHTQAHTHIAREQATAAHARRETPTHPHSDTCTCKHATQTRTHVGADARTHACARIHPCSTITYQQARIHPGTHLICCCPPHKTSSSSARVCSLTYLGSGTPALRRSAQTLLEWSRSCRQTRSCSSVCMRHPAGLHQCTSERVKHTFAVNCNYYYMSVSGCPRFKFGQRACMHASEI